MTVSPPESSKNTKTNVFVPRITQLDAIAFDSDINLVLINQLMEISKFLNPGALNSIKPEIKLLTNLLIHKYSVLSSNATFGQQLLNLKYKGSLPVKLSVLLALFKHGIPYIKEKYEDVIFSYTNENIRKFINGVYILIKFGEILNFFLFLRQGIYPSLTDRILNLRYVPVKTLQRNVGYSYMTRELLWHGFMEFLMFTLPLINYQALKRHLRSYISMHPHKQEKEMQAVNQTLKTKCVVCQEVPIMPCRISNFCPHLSCYYCIKSNILADEKFKCPECGQENTAREVLQFHQNQ